MRKTSIVMPTTAHLQSYDWDQFALSIDTQGFAVLPGLLSAEQCQSLAAQFDQPNIFRSHVVMRRHGFGEGDYKYFSYPLPDPVQSLRASLYATVAPIANVWSERLRQGRQFPDTLQDYLQTCHAAGQTRPTPLLLRYSAGGYNRLHQDLYGELNFPIQFTILLDQPNLDFDGGEFVVTEQKPRAQSRVQVVPLARGDAVALAVNDRPAQGARGYYRLKMRHGVSEIRRGLRRTLGVIFHDAT